MKKTILLIIGLIAAALNAQAIVIHFDPANPAHFGFEVSWEPVLADDLWHYRSGGDETYHYEYIEHSNIGPGALSGWVAHFGIDLTDPQDDIWGAFVIKFPDFPDRSANGAFIDSKGGTHTIIDEHTILFEWGQGAHTIPDTGSTLGLLGLALGGVAIGRSTGVWKRLRASH